MTDRTAARAWLDGYQRAWRTNDAGDIRALFTSDAEYRTEPYADPWRGHDDIVAGWLEARDAPDAYTFEGDVLGIDGDLVFFEGVTRYAGGRNYNNLWVVRLGDDGRAHAYTEWFMKQPDAG